MPSAGQIVPLKTYTTNLADPLGRRLIKIALAVQVADDRAGQDLQSQEARVSDTILMTNDTMSTFLGAGIMVNLGFFAFNMLPIPPLDGSRLLYAIAPEPVQKAMQAIENMGIVVVFAIVFLASGLIGNILGTIIDFILKLFIAVLPI